MSANFEELDYRPTPLRGLSLRRRREPSLGVDLLEIKLGDEFLMSSLFTASEIALQGRPFTQTVYLARKGQASGAEGES